MQRFLCYAAILVMSVLWIFPQNLFAHGTGYRVLNASRPAAMEFYYSDGSTIAYAEILVFSPQDDKVEYQNGRTDRQGRFAFWPDVAGSWRIVVKDGMGHGVEAHLDIAPEARNGENISETAEQPVKGAGMISGKTGAILGISLILNIFSAVYILRRRKQ